MSKYVNTGVMAGKSDFAGVREDDLVDTLTFTSRSNTVATQQGSVKMTSGHVSITSPFKVVCGETCQTSYLNESIRIQWNVKYADVNALAALRAEALRVLDQAVEEFALLNGLVPPASATFAAE